jgi:DNA-binding PadR family transcriptional regulator
VLRALAADPARWRHGYELGSETGLKAGSLYPILIRLADRGLLEAAWEEPAPQGRPARHLYRLTTQGRELAAVMAEDAAEADGTAAALRPGDHRTRQLQPRWDPAT